MELTKLTSTVTVEKYRQLRDSRDREAIADMIYERFSERYIEPFKNHDFKHGFSMMASSCLMIESLYCFQRGRKRTGQPGVDVFEEFFNSSNKLNLLTGYGAAFYKNVRCGILHQGETYGGWKIRRRGPLFSSTDLAINATKFLDALELDVKSFSNSLKESRFHRKPWTGVIRKLDAICENCTG